MKRIQLYFDEDHICLGSFDRVVGYNFHGSFDIPEGTDPDEFIGWTACEVIGAERVELIVR